MSGTTASGYAQLVCDVAERDYGLDSAALLAQAALDPACLLDPCATIPDAAFIALLRGVLARTGDAALGLKLARALDLRTQGFFGYALLSSSTMRERVGVHLRYQQLRGLVTFTMYTVGDQLVADCTPVGLPADLVPVVLDFGLAGACIHHRRRLARARSELAVWVTYREQPHHRELRALVGGPVVFEAPCNRLELPARDLDLPLVGDPHLAKLALAQLDAQLDEIATRGPRDLLAQVRAHLLSRLARDPSLDAIATELRLSARTLRRQLAAHGVSYQELLEAVRHERAAAYLLDTNAAVAWIATQLGYGDPSNFRRAFKRWTGMSPATFRARRRAHPTAAVAARRVS